MLEARDFLARVKGGGFVGNFMRAGLHFRYSINPTYRCRLALPVQPPSGSHVSLDPDADKEHKTSITAVLSQECGSRISDACLQTGWRSPMRPGADMIAPAAPCAINGSVGAGLARAGVFERWCFRCHLAIVRDHLKFSRSFWASGGRARQRADFLRKGARGAFIPRALQPLHLSRQHLGEFS